MNKLVWIVIIIIIIILIFAFAINNDDESSEVNNNNNDGDVSGKVFNTGDFQYVADLENVADNARYQNTTGVALARYENGVYTLGAQFMNLPTPEAGFFYEGWVVRSDPFDTVSTGEIEFTKGGAINDFTSNIDLTDHTKYVLTIEPDDGNPAPADQHIVEGDFEKVE